MLKLKKVAVMASSLFAACLFVSTAEAATHTVKEDENLSEIAERYNITMESLLQLNDLEKAAEAKTDFVLSLPEHITDTALYKDQEKEDTFGGLEVVKTLKVSASAYTANCAGCSGITKTGINLKKNPGVKVIAVDPNVIKLGTKVWVEGYGVAVAGDTGGAIKGNKIDIFVKSRDTALEWGRKKVTIKILKQCEVPQKSIFYGIFIVQESIKFLARDKVTSRKKRELFEVTLGLLAIQRTFSGQGNISFSEKFIEASASMAAHRTTVGMIDSETENLEDMAEQLQQKVHTFKL